MLLCVGLAGGGLEAQGGRTERAGDVIMYGLPVTTLGASLAVEDWVGSRDFLFGFALNTLTTEGLKRAVPKARPDGSDLESFPSGHTSIAFQSATFIHLRYGLEYAVPAYAAAAFVGYSRVYARKHFVEDVAVGLVLGVLSSRLFVDRRPDDDPLPESRIGAALRLRFGGGRGATLGLGLAGLGR